MTTNDAATALGISRRGVLMAIRRGSLPATKRGRDWWITQTAIESYRAERLGRPGRK